MEGYLTESLLKVADGIVSVRQLLRYMYEAGLLIDNTYDPRHNRKGVLNLVTDIVLPFAGKYNDVMFVAKGPKGEGRGKRADTFNLTEGWLLYSGPRCMTRRNPLHDSEIRDAYARQLYLESVEYVALCRDLDKDYNMEYLKLTYPQVIETLFFSRNERTSLSTATVDPMRYDHIGRYERYFNDYIVFLFIPQRLMCTKIP